jgi:SET domain
MSEKQCSLPCGSMAAKTREGDTGLFAERGFADGELIGALPCTAEYAAPTRFTVQVGRARHVEVGPFAFLNHACSPSVRIDTDRMLVLAARAIAAGDELTFFYPSTEWEMACPFVCRCGDPNCIGLVAGARFLPASVMGRHPVSGHIHSLLTEGKGASTDRSARGSIERR